MGLRFLLWTGQGYVSLWYYRSSESYAMCVTECGFGFVNFNHHEPCHCLSVALVISAMTNDQQQELREIILDLKNDIERMAERQTEMNENLKKIKEAVYNPDEGLYARIKALESWKESSQRITWVIMTTVIGLATTTIYKFIVG